MVFGGSIIFIGAILLLVLVGIQVVLATRRGITLGFILPILFLTLAGYNYYKSLFVYNPYPTMAEGMFMTLGIIGFGISLVTLIICRLALKYND